MRTLTLDDIGNYVHMAPSAVSRMFKHKTKKNIWTYLSDVRIERVAKLLIETDISISEIAYKCGFNNISNFNRVFRQRMNGITPNEYRVEAKSSIDSKQDEMSVNGIVSWEIEK